MYGGAEVWLHVLTSTITEGEQQVSPSCHFHPSHPSEGKELLMPIGWGVNRPQGHPEPSVLCSYQKSNANSLVV